MWRKKRRSTERAPSTSQTKKPLTSQGLRQISFHFLWFLSIPDRSRTIRENTGKTAPVAEDIAPRIAFFEDYPPELARVIEIWSELPEALRVALAGWKELREPIRAAILALVGTVDKQGG